jgi:type VI secretion system protein ImpA
MNVPDDFYALEAMVTDHDADGDAPLRRGAQPFSWLIVEQLARRVLQEFGDLRVVLWLLRATMAQRSVVGLAEGLQELIALLSQRPVEAPDEEALEDLGVQLLWLSGPAFRAQVERLRVSVDAFVGTLLELGGRGSCQRGSGAEPTTDHGLGDLLGGDPGDQPSWA